MKSTMKDKGEVKPFPKLMISKYGNVILFSQRGIGTTVYQGEGSTPLGEASGGWNMDMFKDFDGEIILEND